MVSTRQVKQRGNTKVDTRFPIPVGLVDVDYKTDDTIPVEFQPDIDPNDIGGNDQPDPQPTYPYQPPTNITVVSQTVRILPDGSHLVDVLIDVTDIPGIGEYEVRMTKTS